MGAKIQAFDIFHTTLSSHYPLPLMSIFVCDYKDTDSWNCLFGNKIFYKEGQHFYLFIYNFRFFLGDSGYALSDVLITPYPEDQSRADDNKCLFNVRHSQARVEQTEDIYGMLKKRFPYVKYLRVDLPNAIKIIATAAILHNIALDWADPMPVDNHPNFRNLPVPDQPPHVDANEVVIVNDLNAEERRIRASVSRDNYRSLMDPNPTDRERRKMAIHRAEAEARRLARR